MRWTPRRFRQVVDVFHEEVDGSAGRARWSGVIGLSPSRSSSASSTPTTSASGCSRSRCRRGDRSTTTRSCASSRDVCGAFPDSRFLHYNLPRTKRVLSGRGLRRDHPGRAQPRGDQDHRWRDGRRRGADPPRRRAPALHGRGQLPARRDVRRGVAAGVVCGARAAHDATRCSRPAGRATPAS